MKNLELNRNQIKYIAIIAMIIDHIAMFFLSVGVTDASFSRIALYSVMRVIGRLTAPIMFYFLVEGYIHTSSKTKYAIRLWIFGLISQVPYALSHNNKLMVLDFNVIITLAVTFLMLMAYENIHNRILKILIVFALIIATFCCDWGVLGPLMAWLFYKYKDDRKMQIKAYSIIGIIQIVSAAVFLGNNGQHWYGELWQAGLFLVIPFLLSYNGRKGNNAAIHKWIFYIVYPLHLLLFWFIKYKL